MIPLFMERGSKRRDTEPGLHTRTPPRALVTSQLTGECHRPPSRTANAALVTRLPSGAAAARRGAAAWLALRMVLSRGLQPQEWEGNAGSRAAQICT